MDHAEKPGFDPGKYLTRVGGAGFAPSPQPDQEPSRGEQAAADDSALGMANNLKWSGEQRPFVGEIIRGQTAAVLDEIAQRLPRDQHGNPDRMLSDLIEVHLTELVNQEAAGR